MNREETKNLLRVIANAYPNFKPDSLSDAVTVWASMLNEIPFKEVYEALKKFILTDKSGFAPSIGQLMNLVGAPAIETSQEAWQKVRVAVRNSYYNSDSEFAALPDDIKRAVGSSGQLKAWCMMSQNDFELKGQAQFMKAYTAEANKTALNNILPPALREARNVPQIAMIDRQDENATQDGTEAPTDLIERVQQAKESGKSIQEMYEDDLKEIQERWRAIKDGEKNEG